MNVYYYGKEILPTGIFFLPCSWSVAFLLASRPLRFAAEAQRCRQRELAFEAECALHIVVARPPPPLPKELECMGIGPTGVQ